MLAAMLFVMATGLDGAWTAPCIVAQGQDHQYGLRDTVTIAGERFERVSEAHVTTDCTDLNSINTLRGTYRAQEGDGPAPLDFVLSELLITPVNRWVVFFFNQGAFCGFRDWASSVAKDVAGRQCGNTRMPGRGDVFYDLYGQGPDGALYFGLVTDYYHRRSPERRPVELDRGQPFYRGREVDLVP